MENLSLSVFVIIEACLIYWGISYTSKIKINIQHILAYLFFVVLPTFLMIQFFGQWFGMGYFIISLIALFYWLSKRLVTFIHICFVKIICILTDYLTQYALSIFQIQTNPELLGNCIVFSILFVVEIFIYKQSTREIYQLVEGVKVASLLIFIVGLFTVVTLYINSYLVSHCAKNSIVQFNFITQVIYFGFMLFIFYFMIQTIKKRK